MNQAETKSARADSCAALFAAATYCFAAAMFCTDVYALSYALRSSSVRHSPGFNMSPLRMDRMSKRFLSACVKRMYLRICVT